MSEIPDDIKKIATWALESTPFPYEHCRLAESIANAILVERNRSISILKDIEPMNPSEAHLIETIVRRIRGSV